MDARDGCIVSVCARTVESWIHGIRKKNEFITQGQTQFITQLAPSPKRFKYQKRPSLPAAIHEQNTIQSPALEQRIESERKRALQQQIDEQEQAQINAAVAATLLDSQRKVAALGPAQEEDGAEEERHYLRQLDQILAHSLLESKLVQEAPINHAPALITSVCIAL